MSAPNAEFLEHPEFPRYRVTPDGRIYSLRAGRFLKPIQVGKYLGVTITHADGRIVHRTVHRLVLEVTAGPRPPGRVARHLNGDRYDNRSSNLAWGTVRQNAADKVRHGTDPRGTRNPMAKLTWQQVRQIRAMASAGTMQRRIARQFHVSPMTISRVVRGETWKESAL